MHAKKYHSFIINSHQFLKILRKYLPFVSLASEMTAETKSKANKRQPFIMKIGAELIKIEILTILTQL